MKNVTVSVDFSEKVGPIKDMHSVNNGPSGGRGMDNYEAFREAGFPHARTHDAAFSAAYGGQHSVDIINIFPDFDADENDPASYDFVLTDHYMEQILSVGCKPFYRLGNKIEHEIKRYGSIPPKDYAKWARICEHVIRHMNYGWADGHEYGIEYWEIWNEPNLHPQCWDGTNEEFYPLYDVTARHLKKCFPELKIGGPAVTGIGDQNFVKGFLAYLTRDPADPAPLDFFSFHRYAYDPKMYAIDSCTAREIVDSFGYKDTELILNEWNYVKAWRPAEHIRYSYLVNRSIKGASFVAAAVLNAQKSPLDHFMYYDARPGTQWNGLFEFIDKAPMKPYWSLYAFNQLYKLGCEAKSCTDDEDVSAVAAVSADGKDAAILLTYFRDEENYDGLNTGVEPSALTIGWTGFEGEVEAEYCLLDPSHDLETVSCETFTGTAGKHCLALPLYTTVLVKLHRK